MTRWRVDTLFQKITFIILFLVTLIFIFIITNVYVDIDGLIARKTNINTTPKHVKEKIVKNVTIPNVVDKGSRTKRSLELQKFSRKIEKNKKIKNLLTNRLVSLLEELDGDTNNETTEVKEVALPTVPPKDDFKIVYNGNIDDLRHLSLHNVLLKGIIGHMDMSEVYKKIIQLFDSYTPYYEMSEPIPNLRQLAEKSQEHSVYAYEENDQKYDEKILKELLTCRNLRSEVDHHIKKKNNTKPAQHFSINTLIRITDPKEMARSNATKDKFNNNIKGIINLLYNGRRVTINQDNDYQPARVKKITTTTQKITTLRTHHSYSNKHSTESAENKNNLLKRMLYDYYKRNNGMNNYGLPMLTDIMTDQTGSDSEQKRSKRNTKPKSAMNTIKKRDIKPKKGISRRLDKNIKLKNKHDEDLYVEIETHFDDKGQLGAKKKKLIKNLIDKIELAINNNTSSVENKAKNIPKVKKVAQIRRRSQNPLNLNFRVNRTDESLKVSTPVETIASRQINPLNMMISSRSRIERTPNDYTKSDATWKRKYREINQIIAEKENHSNEQTDVNGMIPQRLQEPLNPQEKGVYDVDMGDFKFVIKDIEGTGFTIGFSQYAGDDKEQVKMFTNVEDLLHNYHEDYDDSGHREVADTDGNNPDLKHNMYKRSIDKKITIKHNNNNDYHYNTYKLLYKRKHMLPYKTYKDIYDKPEDMSYKNSILNNIIVDRVMKPSEIFSLAALINSRKKRYIHSRKVTKIRPRTRFLNTRMFPRIIYNKIARTKRGAVSKIRIIAKDFINETNESADDLVLYSDENIFADRALLKDIEIPTENDELPFNYMPVQYYNTAYNSDHLLSKFFDSVRTTHNRMMSKYPHVFIEDVPKPEENEKEKLIEDITELDVPRAQSVEENPQSVEFFNLLKHIPKSEPNPKYKMSFKIFPKNGTDDESGFREVHTSINKTYNKDGRAYVSLLNISEISKIENLLNNTDSHTISNNQSNSPIFLLDGNANHNRMEYDKKIKEMLLIKRDKINSQLKRLEIEKQKIERIMQISTTTMKPDIISDTSIIQNVSKDILLSLFFNAIKNNLTDQTSVSSSTMSTISTTIPTSTNIISNIQDHEILNKIDRNTKVLEEILKTISMRNYDYVNYVMSNEINGDFKNKINNDYNKNVTVNSEIVNENKQDEGKTLAAPAGVTPYVDIKTSLVTTTESKSRKNGPLQIINTKTKYNKFAPSPNGPISKFFKK